MEDSEMKKRPPLILRAASLLLTVLVLLVLLGELFRPRFLNDNYWPLDVTYMSFYEMNPSSADVIFLGSSHAISAFSPQELYDKTGIRSFNLASEEQSLLISYYWLKEALRTQKPEAVVLDTIVCFPYSDNGYNCSEPSIRKALDPMKWSHVKAEAVQAVHELDAKETMLSYVFPLIRYHARWNDLSLNDIHFWPKQNTSLKGYAVLSEDCGIETFEPLDPDPSVPPAVMHPVMKDYLEQLCGLCNENGIQLILVNTPYQECSDAVHNAAEQFAEEHGLRYVDYNERAVTERIGLDFAHDMADAGHANTAGAVKITGDIGTVLLEQGIQARADEQYETTRDYCKRQILNANLYRINDLNDYLTQIDRSLYEIYVTGSDNGAEELLGLNAEGPFTAVIREGMAEDTGTSWSQYRFAENRWLQLRSEEESGTIKVNDAEFERTSAGLQIVLLDIEKGYVIDHSVFDGSGRRIE